MLCSKEELEIYKRFYDDINNGTVKPYELELQNDLRNHTDKNNINVINYLSALCSSYGIGKCYLFSRYLMLFLDPNEYSLKEGYLDSFKDRKFNHCWIEGEEYVYDVTFIGKWPKEEYYKVFSPIVEESIDLRKDDEFQRMMKNNICSVDEYGTFCYVDWYNYMKNNTISFHSTREPLMIKEYPSEEMKLSWKK